MEEIHLTQEHHLMEIEDQEVSSDISGNEKPTISMTLDMLRQRAFPTGYYKEFKEIIKIAWALIVTLVSQGAFQPIATMFAGHLGKLELDAIALSNALINVLGNSIVIGFCSCMETAFSQCYGLKNYKMYGICFQKGLILHVMLLMPCYAICLNIKPILLALGQQEDVSTLTAQYLLYFMPGMFFLFMWTVVRKFTECQNQVAPHNVIALFGHIIHALLQYLFLFQFKFGIMGSSLAQVITFFTLFVMTVIYTIQSKAFKISWFGWDPKCLLEWGSLTSLGIYGMLMMCLEWWALEITLFIAGRMGETELAAQTIIFNLFYFVYGIMAGLAAATGIKVGQYLGSGNTSASVTSARVGITLAVFDGLGAMVLFIALRSQLPKMFTADRDVIDLTAFIMPLAAMYLLGDAMTNLGRAVLRGTGRQKWGTIIIFIAFYVVALPISICLTFTTKLKLCGLWIGLIISLTISGIIYIVVIIYGLNWDALAAEVAMRGRGDIDMTENNNDDLDEHSNDDKADEKTSLIREIEIPTSLYIKRAATVICFLLIPITGLLVRHHTTMPEIFTEKSNCTTDLNITHETKLPQHVCNFTSYYLLP